MSYFNDPNARRSGGAFEPSTDWWAFTYSRLFWLYGDDQRARQTTPASLADQAAWRNLGQRSAA